MEPQSFWVRVSLCVMDSGKGKLRNLVVPWYLKMEVQLSCLSRLRMECSTSLPLHLPRWQWV